MKKRRHHFIWQHYLAPWVSDGALFCQRENRIFPTGTTMIGVEKDFYRVHDMTGADLRVLWLLLRKFPPDLRELQVGWIEMFASKSALEAAFGGQHPALDELIDEHASNLEEDWHMSIEGDTIALLTDLQNGRCGFFSESEGFQKFIFYVILQSLRTRRTRDRLVQALEGLDLPDSFKGFDAARVQGVLRLMFATSTTTYYIAHREHCRLTLLEAAQGAEFITGDQPVINTYARHLGPLEPPTKAEFYYPISPQRAVLIGDVRDRAAPAETHLEPEAVTKYNQMIVEASQFELYGRSKEVLEQCSLLRGASTS